MIERFGLSFEEDRSEEEACADSFKEPAESTRTCEFPFFLPQLTQEEKKAEGSRVSMIICFRQLCF